MKRNLFFRMLARLKVGRKLLLIYLLDLSAVVFISSILIHEKYVTIDFSNKEIVGNQYIRPVRAAMVDVALAGAGQSVSPAQLRHDAAVLEAAERADGADMQSAALNERARAALELLAQQPRATTVTIDDAFQACRELVTRVGNQSNLILDPDLDSYYSMSLSILRYPALLDAVNGIGKQVRSPQKSAAEAMQMRTQYLVLEGQLDAVLQGFKSDYAEATAANHALTLSLGGSVADMLNAIEA